MADTTDARATRACSSCKTSLADSARFCANCGAAAPTSTAAPSDPVRDILKVALGRQYEIQRLLGRGGMGAVYLATEAALEREVAIKVLPPDRGSTQDSRDRFRREARTAAKLSHPNIVPLYTFGDVDGTLYFVMGYVKGESLAARLKREGRLPVEDARRILIEMAEALDYAHKLGVIHRDIKPDNVLLEEGTGRARLTDFGVAKALGAGQTLTEIGGVLGTPHYMSPEQAQGKSDIDHRSDLYSLGVMGYAMLAGRLPFEGATPGDVMVQHITKEAPPLKTHAPATPSELASALARCLVKSPSQRWPDAKSLKEAISPNDEERPLALDGLGTFVVVPALSAEGMLCVGAWYLGGGKVSPPFEVLPLMIASAGLTPALLLPWRWRHLRRLGFEPARIKEAIFEPLRSGLGWCPEAWRPEGDVWARLPRELRDLRAATGWTWLIWLGVGAPALVFQWAQRASDGPWRLSPGEFDAFTLLLAAAPALVLGALAVRWELLRRKRGIDPYLSARMINAATSRRSFWSKPEVAALLLPAGSRADVAGAAPASPRDLASEISNAASSLSGEAKEAGARARESAFRVLAALDEIEPEIAAMGSGADPAEEERLAVKIAALGPPLKGEPGARSQMRDLLERQRALIRESQTRLEGLRARRARHLDLLGALCRQAKELVAASGDPGRTGRISERIRTLCGEITHEAGASAATRAIDTAVIEAPTIERP